MSDMTAIINAIHQRAPGFKARVGMILGSGLSGLADHLQDKVMINYADLPGFPVSHVPGHANHLVLGTLFNVPIACLQGRVHTYEGLSGAGVKTLVRTLKLLGCEMVIITNASGSLRGDVGPGSVSLIADHINFQGTNPLMGPNDEKFGPRFFAMDNAYDAELRQRMHATAARLQMPLTEGVYISVLGPCFETPAEIRAFKTLGADLVGMSTVNEVLVARHCGLKVVAIATITNLAAGLSDESLSHEGTLHFAKKCADKLLQLVKGFIEDLS